MIFYPGSTAYKTTTYTHTFGAEVIVQNTKSTPYQYESVWYGHYLYFRDAYRMFLPKAGIRPAHACLVVQRRNKEREYENDRLFRSIVLFVSKFCRANEMAYQLTADHPYVAEIKHKEALWLMMNGLNVFMMEGGNWYYFTSNYSKHHTDKITAQNWCPAGVDQATIEFVLGATMPRIANYRDDFEAPLPSRGDKGLWLGELMTHSGDDYVGNRWVEVSQPANNLKYTVSLRAYREALGYD